jgi:hypothetical protein
MTGSNTAILAGRARRVRSWLSICVVFLGTVLLLERLGYAGVYRGAGSSGALAAQLLLSVPALLQLAALWQLRMAAAAVAHGQAFAPAVVRGLTRTGACLMVGSAMSFIMPLVHRALEMAVPRSIDLDVAAAILAAIGGGLIFIARLISRAGDVQTELDAIF